MKRRRGFHWWRVTGYDEGRQALIIEEGVSEYGLDPLDMAEKHNGELTACRVVAVERMENPAYEPKGRLD